MRFGAAAPFRDHGQDSFFHLFGVSDQPAIWRARKIHWKKPNRSGKTPAQPFFNQAAERQSFGGIVTKKHRACDLQSQLPHLGVNVVTLARPPAVEHLGRNSGHQIVITSDRRLVKRRHHELALLAVLLAGHARESETHAALRRICRTAQKQSRWPKFRRIAQDLTIEFGSHSQHMKLGRFSQCDRAQNHERPAPFIKTAH